MSTKKWIDISLPIRSGMVHWPGDQKVFVKRVKTIGRRHRSNLSKIILGSHTGTHIDAPLHCFKSGHGLDVFSLDTFIGPARVINITHKESIKIDELRKYRIYAGERILFKTNNSSKCYKTNRFIRDAVYITQDAADYLTSKKVRLVGIDYLSVGSYYRGGHNVHRKLLGEGICILEGINLSDVHPGKYDLVCLPLKIANADGAPVRAVIRRRG